MADLEGVSENMWKVLLSVAWSWIRYFGTLRKCVTWRRQQGGRCRGTGDRTYLNQVLADGKDRAPAVAAPTLKKVKDAMGFIA